MSEPMTPERLAAIACTTCAEYGTWEGTRLIEPFIPPIDLGHDADAHRVYLVLLRNGIKDAAELATYRDVELLKLRGLGRRTFTRIREVLPEPDGAS